MTRALSWAIPAGAWDCHTHIFGPANRFPARIASVYPLPEAPFGTHRANLEAVGIERAVLIQPAPYAQDVGAMLDAIELSKGTLRGVGSAVRTLSDTALETMSMAGIRGLRFLETKTPGGDLYPGSVQLDDLILLAPRMRALGMHAEIWSALDDLLQKWPLLASLNISIVLDHMGGFDLAKGVEDASFQTLLRLVREGAVSVKLTLCRRAPFGSDLAQLRPFHDALVNASPRHVLWGSDWPFVRMGEHAPKMIDLLELFGQWVDDPALRQQILVENANAYYNSGFAA